MVGRLLSLQMVTFQFRSIKLQGMHGWTQTINKSPESLATKRWDHWPTCSWSCLQVDKILLKLFLVSLSKFAHKKRIALLIIPTHQNIGQMRNLPQRATIDAVSSSETTIDHHPLFQVVRRSLFCLPRNYHGTSCILLSRLLVRAGCAHNYFLLLINSCMQRC